MSTANQHLQNIQNHISGLHGLVERLKAAGDGPMAFGEIDSLRQELSSVHQSLEAEIAQARNALQQADGEASRRD